MEWGPWRIRPRVIGSSDWWWIVPIIRASSEKVEGELEWARNPWRRPVTSNGAEDKRGNAKAIPSQSWALYASEAWFLMSLTPMSGKSSWTFSTELTSQHQPIRSPKNIYHERLYMFASCKMTFYVTLTISVSRLMVPQLASRTLSTRHMQPLLHENRTFLMPTRDLMRDILQSGWRENFSRCVQGIIQLLPILIH